MQSLGQGIKQTAGILFETYGKQCPECGAFLLRPRVVNKKTGKKMAGACMECGYREPITSKKVTRSQAKIELEGRKTQAFGYLIKYSVFSSSHVFDGNFKNFEADMDEQKYMATVMKRFAHDIAMDRVEHAIISGNAGQGKTHMASAVVSKIFQETSFTKKIIFLDMLLTNEMADMSIKDDEAKKKIKDIIYQARKADLVILDDLGTERDTEWGKKLFTEMMTIRENKPLLVTTNLDNTDFNERYRESVISRLNAHSNGFVISISDKVPDYRQRG